MSPLFEFRCPICNHLAERLEKNPPPSTTPCLHCCKAEAVLVPSVASFTIKGVSCH
jgi:hypothetical protein